MRAEVTVAEPLSDAHLGALEDGARRDFGQSIPSKSPSRSIRSIIGGLIVKLGSRMVDGSLKTKLNSIRTRMKEVG